MFIYSCGRTHLVNWSVSETFLSYFEFFTSCIYFSFQDGAFYLPFIHSYSLGPCSYLVLKYPIVSHLFSSPMPLKNSLGRHTLSEAWIGGGWRKGRGVRGGEGVGVG